MIITPGILESHWSELARKATLFANKSTAELVQIDICDHRFVRSVTWPFVEGEGAMMAERIEELRARGIVVEFDLMIQNPEEKLVQFLLTNPRRVIVHFSSTQNLDRCFAVLHGYSQDYPKFEYGIAVTVNDTFEMYQKYLKRLHFIQVMGIETIGAQGQPLSDRVFDIIERIRMSDPELPIQVDGGVSISLLVQLQDAGVSSVVVGSALFTTDNPVATRAVMMDKVC